MKTIEKNITQVNSILQENTRKYTVQSLLFWFIFLVNVKVGYLMQLDLDTSWCY